jgi:hypothetical protein
MVEMVARREEVNQNLKQSQAGIVREGVPSYLICVDWTPLRANMSHT